MKSKMSGERRLESRRSADESEVSSMGKRSSRQRHCRTDHLFRVEVPFVDPFDLVAHFQAYADLVLDHQMRQFVTVDQGNAFRTLRHLVLSRPGETGGSDEHS